MSEDHPAFFQGNYLTLSWLVFLPMGTMMLGSLLVFKVEPGPAAFSAMQHLASGILIGACVWEIGPHMEAHSDTEKESIILGYLVGFGLLMLMARFKCKWKPCQIYDNESQGLVEEERGNKDFYSLDIEETNTNNNGFAPGTCPIGLIAAVWMNGAIDGTLIGISYIGGGAAGLITALALAIEQGLLGITTAKSIMKSFSASATLAISLSLAIPIPVCGLISGTLLANVSGAIYIGLNSFGLAGLLYLVTEELLVEAHEDHTTDTWYVTIQFFTGFLFVIAMDNFLPQDL